MANKYAGTQTEKNLEAAFAGESMARNKYTYYASKAKKDGFEQIAALFLKTADNEKEHSLMLKLFISHTSIYYIIAHSNQNGCENITKTTSLRAISVTRRDADSLNVWQAGCARSVNVSWVNGKKWRQYERTYIRA
jgi:rubrerythrin